ncbi:MAG TPA: response regulator, partial [Acidiferrobacteraceae bacterium]|nr:response regulator [Acidiferrobacteraceae bacterium]
MTQDIVMDIKTSLTTDKCCASQAQDDDKLVYLAGGDELLAADRVADIERAGYRVRFLDDLSDMEAACGQEIPVAIIMELVAKDGDVTAAYVVARLKDNLQACPPVIFISGHCDIKARLAVARMCTSYYFCKPVDVKKLIQTLDTLTSQIESAPYRVLLVDDEEDLLGYYAKVLRNAGMQVETLSRPLEGLEVLARFKPDVLVLDVYMPGCSGPELAQVIRQDDGWASMAIMFLSSEVDLSRQLAAMKLGGDDFLVKPVEADHLETAVIARAKRARQTTRLSKALEASLRESKYLLIAMDQHSSVSVTDVDGCITAVNDKFCKISGYSREELLGQNHRLIKSGVHPVSFYEKLWDTVSQGKVWRGVTCNHNKRGDEFWVKSTIVPFLDDKGEPYKYVATRTDITALRASEERLFRSQVFANIGTWDWDIRTDRVVWSERIGPLLGYEYDVCETSYENFGAALHPDDRQQVMDALENCVEHGARYDIEFRVVWPDGSVHWIHASGDVVCAKDGEPLHMLGVVQDIDGRKCAELALMERERQLHEAQALAHIGNWQADLVSGELIWSDEVYRIFGHVPGGFEPGVESFFSAVHPDDLEKIQASQRQAAQTGHYDVLYRIVRPDGTVLNVHELAQAETDGAGSLIRLTGTVQDVTETVAMRCELERQRTLLDMLHRSTTDFVVKGDLRLSMNTLLDALLELTESEYGLIGEVFFDDHAKPYLKTHAITNIAWSPGTQKLYDELEEKGFEFRNLNNLLGRVLTSRESIISNHPASDPQSGGLPKGHPAMNAFLGKPIFYGNELVGMYGVANCAGGYDEEIQEFLRPFNATLGVMIHSRRILEMDEHNRKALFEAKEEAENANHIKSQFLSSMSHELRTPMNAIMGFGQLLKMETDKLDVSQQENVDEILKAADHLMELINDVLDLARIEEGRIDLSIESVVVSGVVDETLHLIMPLAKKRGIEIILRQDGADVSFEQVLQQHHHMVRVDRTRFKQVMLNLLSNAVKYNSDNGKLIIACDHINEQRMRISVTDTGAGLTQQQQGQLFKAFYRLGAEQSEIEGSGIGLVITRNIVELMGGAIGVVSAPGEGSTFWIELQRDTPRPVQKKEVGENKSPSPQAITTSAHKHSVLYIEDNPANLRLVVQLLGRRPRIHTWSAPEPLLGLELAAEHQPDLILLDINLPGMDGFEVLKRLRQ